ncbi:MAG TPA: hypothetical protein VFU63_10535, partial [Ktedonobacterales bacterium]|nr:hypothetical protein [Ktedonobacterales bacterium]
LSPPSLFVALYDVERVITPRLRHRDISYRAWRHPGDGTMWVRARQCKRAFAGMAAIVPYTARELFCVLERPWAAQHAAFPRAGEP